MTTVSCPICGTAYSMIKRAGQRCDDLSRDQARPCVGRLIPDHELERAEWRFLHPHEDSRSADILKAMREDGVRT